MMVIYMALSLDYIQATMCQAAGKLMHQIGQAIYIIFSVQNKSRTLVTAISHELQYQYTGGDVSECQSSAQQNKNPFAGV